MLFYIDTVEIKTEAYKFIFSWYSLLEGTRWLQHMAGLLRAAVTVVSAVDQEGRPVLVHCSDGWDRTPQIVALAEVLLDPYYRTVEVSFSLHTQTQNTFFILSN